MKRYVASFGCAAAMTVACGGDGASGAYDADAGGHDASANGSTDAGASNSGPADGAVYDDSAMHDTSVDDASDADGGAPACGDDAVRCNGTCLHLGESAGNCTVFAQLSNVGQIVADSAGELYASVYVAPNQTGATIVHIPAAGGAPIPLTDMIANVDQLALSDTDVYFSTARETSTKYSRLTGSIGKVPRQGGGAATILVHDVPNGELRRTATNLYMSASDLSPGLRRYDLAGQNETVLRSEDVRDFEIVGDHIYFIESGFGTEPVKVLSLAGGTASDFGGGQCRSIIGSDTQNLYAQCDGTVRISLSDGTTTPLVQQPDDWQAVGMRNADLFYTSRNATTGGKVQRYAGPRYSAEDLITVEASFYLPAMAVTSHVVYVVASRAFHPDLPVFILKVDG